MDAKEGATTQTAMMSMSLSLAEDVKLSACGRQPTI